MNQSISDDMMIDTVEEEVVVVVPVVVESETYSASDESESTTVTSTTITATDNSTTEETELLLPEVLLPTTRATATATTTQLTRYDDSILWYNIVETKQYQIALTLNNVGISFLEIKAYYDAVHILKKANSIMSYLISTRVLLAEDADTNTDTTSTGSGSGSDNASSTSSSSMSLDKLNKYTQIAYDRLRSSQRQKQRRLLRSNNSKKSISFCKKQEELCATSTSTADNNDDDNVHYSSNTNNNNNNMFDVTVLQDSNINELQIAADEYPTRNNGYVIRIDTTCKYYTSNVVVQAAVISMNFAIARRCMINYNPKQQNQQQKQQQQCIQNAITKASKRNHYNPHRIQQREIFYTERAYKLYTYALTLLQQEAIALNSIPFNDYCSTNDSIVSLIHRTRTVHTSTSTSGNTYNNNSTSHHDTINVPMQQRIDLMTILAIQGLMYMALDLNLLIDANMYYCTLGDLHLSHTRYDTSVVSPLHNLAPAA